MVDFTEVDKKILENIIKERIIDIKFNSSFVSFITITQKKMGFYHGKDFIGEQDIFLYLSNHGITNFDRMITITKIKSYITKHNRENKLNKII